MMNTLLETAGKINGPNGMPGADLFKPQGCRKIKAPLSLAAPVVVSMLTFRRWEKLAKILISVLFFWNNFVHSFSFIRG